MHELNGHVCVWTNICHVCVCKIFFLPIAEKSLNLGRRFNRIIIFTTPLCVNAYSIQYNLYNCTRDVVN